jgi:hypothetical protein
MHSLHLTESGLYRSFRCFDRHAAHHRGKAGAVQCLARATDAKNACSSSEIWNGRLQNTQIRAIAVIAGHGALERRGEDKRQITNESKQLESTQLAHVLAQPGELLALLAPRSSSRVCRAVTRLPVHVHRRHPTSIASQCRLRLVGRLYRVDVRGKASN